MRADNISADASHDFFPNRSARLRRSDGPALGQQEPAAGPVVVADVRGH